MVVKPGTDGRISVHNQAGRTNLSITVVGWLPADSSYRPVTPALVHASAHGAPLAAGATVDIQVAGVGGVPAIDGDTTTEEAHSVLLSLRADPVKPRATALTVFPAGDARPETTSLAAPGALMPSSSLTVVPLSADGRVSLYNADTAADVRVVVVGWFATPLAAAQVLVPETTKVPEAEEITSVDVTHDESGAVTGATVALDPEAPDVAPGDHLVLGITQQTPEGLLGTVTGVTTAPDGSQVVTTEPALLEEVFPEGDIVGSLAEVSKAQAARQGVMMLAKVMPDPGQKGTELKDPFEDADLEGLDDNGLSCSLDGVDIDFGPYVDMEFAVHWRWLKAPRVTALVTLGAQAKIALHDVAVTCGWEPSRIRFTVMAGPVVLTFEVGAAVNLSAGLAGLDIEASAKAWVTVGVKDNAGYADAGWDITTPSFKNLLLQARHLRAYALVDTWLIFGVKLYGVIGPEVWVGPFLETGASTEVRNPVVPWWTVDIGLAAKVNLKLDLWFKSWEWQLWDAEIPLADWLYDTGLMENCGGASLAFMITEPEWKPCRAPSPPDGKRVNGTKRNVAARIRLASSEDGMSPLAITGPSNIVTAMGQPVSVDFGVSGFFSNDALIRVDPNTQGIPGLAMADLQDGWSTSGHVEGIPPAAGTYALVLEARYKVEDSPPDLSLRAHRTIYVTVQPPVMFGRATALAAGDGSTCALLQTGSIVCWGINGIGQLGDGTTTQRLMPVMVSGISGATAVTAGSSHTCALMAGKVRCWGLNSSGQLGDGSTTNRTTPITASGISTATAIAAGAEHTCAVLQDGSVRCWGSNDQGQLGDGTRVDRSAPVTVPGITTAVAIAAGGHHTCALLTPASAGVRCWGDNQSGQLGDGSTTDRTAPVAVSGITTATAIAAGSAHSCARLSTGQVRCWGSNVSGQLGNGTGANSAVPVGVSGITTAVSVASGSFHSCAVLTSSVPGSGAVRCWGSNGYGQLGDESSGVNRLSPVTVVGVSRATAIGLGRLHSCAVLQSGAVACWGENGSGQLGDATTADRLSAVAVIGFATAPGAPTGASATRGNASAVVTWSAPFETGGSIISTYTVAATPGGRTCTWTAGPLTCKVTGLTNGTGYTFTVTATNAVGTGAPSDPSASVVPAPTVPEAPTAVTAVRGNAQATVSWTAPDNGGSPITRYTVTASRGGRTCTWTTGPLTCTVTGLTNGLSTAFTVKATNAIGIGPASEASNLVTPATVPGAPTAVAAAAVDGTALVTWTAPASDGGTGITGYTVTASPGGRTCTTTGDRECFVEDLTNGQAYTFTVTATNDVGTSPGSTPTDPVSPAVLAAVAVATGSDGHTCAVLASGSVICWGANESGQLGNGMTEDSAVPVIVRGIGNASSVAAGDGYTCARLSTRQVKCWGTNSSGQLGNGTTTQNLFPVAVSGITTAIAIAAGDGHTCALLDNRTIRCWGSNGHGQLGNGTWTNRTTPAAVSGINTASSIAAGQMHTCAVLTTQVVRCWGLNYNHQLGDGTTTDRNAPVAVAGVTGATTLAAGYHTCALLASGTLRCWGDSTIDVSGITTATAVAAGSNDTCVVLESGAVQCWGWNAYGQLGDGTRTDRWVPATVMNLSNASGIAVGGFHTCALRGPGWVACWGNNLKGQLGDGTMTSSSVPVVVLGFPTPPGAPTGVTASAGGGRATVTWSAPDFDGGSPITTYAVTASPGGHGCTTTGAMACVVNGLETGTAYTFIVVAVNAVGRGPSSAPSDPITPVAGQSRLVAWGDNAAGQTVIPAGVTDAVAVAAGTEHSLALRGDGTVVAWGGNTHGQATVPAGLTSVVAVAAGANHSLALRADGTVVAWGADDSGQATIPAGLGDVSAIAAGARHSLALLEDGTIVGWGSNTDGELTPPADLGPVTAIAAGSGFSLALQADGTVVAWGEGGAGQTTIPEELSGNVTAIAAGLSHAVAVTPDGQVVAWGDDSLGQTDVPADAWGLTAIAAGANHTLAIRIDGIVIAWGDNSAGQARVPAGLTGAIAIAGGGAHSVVLATREQTIYFDATCPALVGRPGAVIAGASSSLPVTFTTGTPLVCTVDASTGDLTLLAAGTCSVTASQAGNADWNPAQPVTRDVTVAVPDSPIIAWGDVSACQCSVPPGIDEPVAIAAGGVHNLALASDGHVTGWGDNQLGQASVPAGLADVTKIDAGFMHSLALRSDGTVVAWGADDAGQGSIPSDLVDDLVGITAISAGGNHNLALRSDHTVVAWGSNDQGESNVPGSLANVTAVAAGMSHSLALRSDGTVVAWGDDSFGQATVPAGLTGVVAIAAGGRHSLALLSDGTVVAWGDDSFGQATQPASLSGVVAIAAGGTHSLVVLSDGTVVSSAGIDTRLARIPAGLHNVLAIDAGEYHSLALFSE